MSPKLSVVLIYGQEPIIAWGQPIAPNRSVPSLGILWNLLQKHSEPIKNPDALKNDWIRTPRLYKLPIIIDGVPIWGKELWETFHGQILGKQSFGNATTIFIPNINGMVAQGHIGKNIAIGIGAVYIINSIFIITVSGGNNGQLKWLTRSSGHDVVNRGLLGWKHLKNLGAWTFYKISILHYGVIGFITIGAIFGKGYLVGGR